MELWFEDNSSSAFQGEAMAAVCECSESVCALIPPPDANNFPCYQGSNADASKCFKTDPLLKDGTTWSCGNCSAHGYPYYKQNDPVRIQFFPINDLHLSYTSLVSDIQEHGALGWRRKVEYEVMSLMYYRGAALERADRCEVLTRHLTACLKHQWAGADWRIARVFTSSQFAFWCEAIRTASYGRICCLVFGIWDLYIFRALSPIATYTYHYIIISLLSIISIIARSSVFRFPAPAIF
jgi:hypothetical protein